MYVFGVFLVVLVWFGGTAALGERHERDLRANIEKSHAGLRGNAAAPMFPPSAFEEPVPRRNTFVQGHHIVRL